MKYTLPVEFGGCSLSVTVNDYGPGVDDWSEEGIYYDGDLTDLLQALTQGGKWAGYDKLMDKVHEALVEARRHPFGYTNAATAGYRSEAI